MLKHRLYRQDTSVTAAVMFFFFAISVNFILINVLITIILEGYENVKAEMAGKKNELEVIQYIKDVAKFMVGRDKRPGFLQEFAPQGLKNEKLVTAAGEDSQLKDEEEAAKDKEESVMDDIKDEEAEDKEESVMDELPEKVDQILKYINDTYFEGELDLKTKKMLAKSVKQQ